MLFRCVSLLCVVIACGCADYRQGGDSGGYGRYVLGNEGHRFGFQEMVRANGFPPPATNAPLRPHAKLAVAEMGKPMPSKWIIDAFPSGGQFTAVVPCDGGNAIVQHRPTHSATRPTTQERFEAARQLAQGIDEQALAALDDARAAARADGCDYVAVVLWNGSGQLRGGVLEWLDLLIFPMYVIPHDRAVANVAGMVLLMDTRDGTVVRLYESSAHTTRYGTYMAMKNVVRLALDDAQKRVAKSLIEGIAQP